MDAISRLFSSITFFLIGCPALPPAGVPVRDLSDFSDFTLEIDAFGVDACFVDTFSFVSIGVDEWGNYEFEAGTLESGRSGVDECDFDPIYGCYSETVYESRTLTAEEVQELRSAFATVEFRGTLPICRLSFFLPGSFDPCHFYRLTWDDFSVSDSACDSYRVNSDTIIQLLERLVDRSTPIEP